MGMFNCLDVVMQCPFCDKISFTDSQFKFGSLRLDNYQLGDELKWDDPPRGRPIDGDWVDETFAICEYCNGDIYLAVQVRQDIIVDAEVDPTKDLEVFHLLPITRLHLNLQDPTWHLRWAAIQVLRQFPQFDSEATLRFAQHDRNPFVQQAALKALQERQQSDFCAALANVGHRWPRSPNQEVPAWGPPLPDLSFAEMVTALKSPDMQSIASVMANIKRYQEAAVSPLLEAIDETHDPFKRISLIATLFFIIEHVPTDVLMVMYSDGMPLDRIRILWELRRAGRTVPETFFLNALHDDDFALRKTALEVMGGWPKGRLPHKELNYLLGDSAGDIRSKAFDILVQIETGSALVDLLAALGDCEYVVRRRMLASLQRYHPEMLPMIIEQAQAIVTEKDAGGYFAPIARAHRIATIGSPIFSLPKKIDLLEEALYDPFWQVRAIAIDSLIEGRQWQHNSEPYGLSVANCNRLQEMVEDSRSYMVSWRAEYALKYVFND